MSDVSTQFLKFMSYSLADLKPPVSFVKEQYLWSDGLGQGFSTSGPRPLVGLRRFCGGPQSYSKNWLLGSKKSFYSYIYGRIDKNWRLRCADLFFVDQGKIRSSKGKDLFFWDQGNHWANNADSKVETFFFRRSRQLLGKQRWLESGDLFFEAEGHKAMIHRAMGHANFQKTQNGPRFRKGLEPLV